MSVEVVIPAYNNQSTIGDTLKALEIQSFYSFKTIVVDDGSTDETAEVVERFKKKSKISVKLIKQKNKGPATARNQGAEEAKSEIIVFLDADCKPRKNWLAEMIKPFDNEGVVGVQGTYETWNKHFLIARYVGYEIDYRHEGMKKQEKIDFVGSFSAAYKRKIFLDEKGFDTSFRTAASEDQELAARLYKKGYKLVFNPEAVVAHRHPERLKSYLQQQFWRGYWRIPVYLRHKDMLAEDKYTGKGLVTQGFLSTIFFLGVLILKIPLLIIAFSLLFLTNIPLGFYCSRKELKFILLGPIIASLRSLSGTLGAGYGIARYRLLR
ncbi:glycosyltransferase [Candidatus Altiarchaeota archaeon]